MANSKIISPIIESPIAKLQKLAQSINFNKIKKGQTLKKFETKVI